MSETITINGKVFPIVSWERGVVPVIGPPAKARAKPRKAPVSRRPPLSGGPVENGTLALSMAPPSVNALFFNRRGGSSKSPGRGKTLAYRNWCRFANIELCAQPAWHVPGRVAVTIRVGGSRADADNLLKAALDALVSAGRIMDDRLVMEARAIHDDSVVGTLIDVRIVK